MLRLPQLPGSTVEVMIAGLISHVIRIARPDLVNMGQCTGEVLAQVPLCTLRFPICNRPQNAAMVLNDGGSFARCREMKPAQPIKMAALPAYEHP